MSSNISEIPGDGILLIDKKAGKTSFDIVKGVRRLLEFKKVGHAGTLDPFATGLLIVLIGQGTKLSQYLLSGKKRYLATIKLGVETDTMDSTGRELKKIPVGDIDIKEISDVLQKLTGVIEQVPPAFSAINIDGQRAYKLARRGIKFELKKRGVTIFSIDVKKVQLPFVTIDVCCSAGTYIRSLASDIGKRLETVAHLFELRRLSSGMFNVDDAMTLTNLSSLSSNQLMERIIPISASIPDMLPVHLEDNLALKVRNGYRPTWIEVNRQNLLPDDFKGIVKLVKGSSLVAVMEIDRSPGQEEPWFKKIRVFN